MMPVGSRAIAIGTPVSACGAPEVSATRALAASKTNDSRTLVSKLNRVEPRLDVEMAALAYKCSYQQR